MVLKLGVQIRAAAHAMGTTKTEDDVVREAKKEHSKEGRFKGKLMSLSVIGQEKVTKVLTSRVGPLNVDRIARIMSSNRCENFFSMLTKHSEGKRIHLGQSDSFEVMLHFAAGTQSNQELTTEILEQVGGETSSVREIQMAKI